MRTPTRRIDLGTIGYDGFYVVVPQSVKEGFIYDVTKLARDVPDDASETEKAAIQAESNRDVSIRFLELVSEWNLTDESDAPLPLVREQKGKTEAATRDAKVAIVKEVEVDILAAISEGVSGKNKVSERVKAF